MHVSTSRLVVEKPAVLIDSPCTISLVGIIIVQTHLYYQTFPNDQTFQKVSVRVVASINRKHFLMLYSTPGGDPHVSTV
jgi:hypothetical protein